MRVASNASGWISPAAAGWGSGAGEAGGGPAASRGVPLSAVEAGIAFSVLVLGIAIAADRRLPLMLAMLAVGFFAIFHGYAHGAEMPRVAEPVRYAAGFLCGTAALHVLGVIIGDVPRHYARGKLVLRLIGGGIAGIGSWFVLGMV